MTVTNGTIWLSKTSDSSWTSGDRLTILCTVIAVTVAVIIYLLQRQPKFLTWSVYYALDFYMPWRDIIPLSTVRYVDKPNYIMVSIRNLGKVEIRREDFQTPATPATFVFPYGTIVAAKGGSSFSKDPVDVTLDDHSLVIDPILLNIREAIHVVVLLDGSADGVQFECRISGQNHKHEQISFTGELAPGRVMWRRLPARWRVAIVGSIGVVLAIVTILWGNVKIIGH